MACMSVLASSVWKATAARFISTQASKPLRSGSVDSRVEPTAEAERKRPKVTS